ncbi:MULTISPECIES: hypothetical protein [unclassified Acidocella]|uniref:hypothetical protein n=1 Tax=unclassified Acidocella TaxID=2648610 RepID=UPI00028F1BED|nr:MULTISPECIES: hypothetical protein [unclassified Acidocella]EKM98074.1 hypothetical protein MXAZACID_17361 [Acidocella sp. MX-AZ02]WBO59004.1 hypothetical protein GT370_18280 [Acidocella sp. MX-AZ03]WBO59455.1 hypothetical protein GT370_00435 [Acidocella sp. MX-AZ03]
MQWIIDPYRGAGKIQFGMSVSDIETICGSFRKKTERPSGILSCSFKEIEYPTLNFRSDALVHMDFGWRTEAVYVGGLDYFHANPEIFLEEIRKQDSELWIDIENSFLSPKYGIAFDRIGLEESDKVIGAFSRMEMESMIKKFGVRQF